VSQETGFLDRSIFIGGTEHRYVVYVPLGYDPLKSWPTILFLHGSGESGTDGLRQLTVGLGPAIMAARDQWPFVVLFPQKPEHKMLWPNAATMLDRILAQTEEELEVDVYRRYLTGISQGGHGAFTLARSLRWTFAAIAPVCGFAESSVVPSLQGLPAWAFHGEQDETVSPDSAVALVEGLQAVGSDARMTLYPDLDHNSWDRAYREEALGEWLLNHRRPFDSNR
jgi:predicted peptidase